MHFFTTTNFLHLIPCFFSSRLQVRRNIQQRKLALVYETNVSECVYECARVFSARLYGEFNMKQNQHN